MKKHSAVLALTTLLSFTALNAEGWPQGSGADGNFQSTKPAPTEWSVALDQQIDWKLTLPETGQNTPVISNGKVFFSTYQPFENNTKIGKDITAWCCDANSGAVIWKRDIPAQYDLRLSGCFSDSTSPPAVSDGEHVVFVNASGAVECFTHEGAPVWRQEFLSVGRTIPFLHDDKVVFTRQQYPPDPNGHFPHKYKDAPKKMWTQLQALDIKTGEIAWTSECGCNLGMTMMPQKLSDGRDVVIVGRGGGHGPPEKPLGLSLIDLADGKTLWTLPINNFAATMSYGVRNDQVHVFHGPQHLSIDCHTGKIVKRISIHDKIPLRRWNGGKRTTTIETIEGGKSRNITQGSNLLVGPWNYFRHYKNPWLGRVNVDTGTVEYLELPLQNSRAPDQKDELRWLDPKGPKLEAQTIVPNDMKNSRGLVVFDDKRCTGTGWGHIASPTPTVAGKNLYLPVMTGTVYVIEWNANTLDENAVVAINDLGLAGQSFTRSSISFASGKAYAHTIKEIICIGK
jgi:outer membrane protein assembly factor BamB